MIKLINCRTNTVMWVADSRVDEYLAAGHTLAVDTPDDEKPTKPAKRRRRKDDNDICDGSGR